MPWPLFRERMDDLELINTGDGSHSIRNKALDETYHSVHGAIQESTYVFVESGLKHRLLATTSSPVRILEIGFGTGLNALLTAVEADRCQREILYTTIELHPLPAELIEQLNYAGHLAIERALQLYKAIHDAPWEVDERITPWFTLHKIHGDLILQNWKRSSFDVIYFDAFAPSRQPDLWTAEVLSRVTSALSPAGVFVTYCARGQVKRDLRSLGLTVETLPGPPGKKEMTRASRN